MENRIFEIKTEAIDHLKNASPQLKEIIEKYGKVERELGKGNLMLDLIDSVIAQLISTKAAKTIENRFYNLFESIPNAKQIIEIEDQKIRECGISKNKIIAIKGIANAFENGDLDSEVINNLSDEEIIVKLSSLKGIGKWTAEMVSLFSLARENIFSYGDLAIRNSIKTIHSIKELDTKAFEKLKKKFSPYCSTAMIYYWHDYGVRNGSK